MAQHRTQTGLIFTRVADAYQRSPRRFSQALYEGIAALCPPASDTCMLDVGCGTGTTAHVLANVYPNVYGLDASFEMLSHAAQVKADRPIVWTQGIAEHLPFASNSIAVITAAQSFHWFDGEAFLTEARRVLKPRGLIAMFWKGPRRGEPYRKLMDRTIDEQLCVSHIKTPLGDVKHILSASGFTDVQVKEFEFDLEWTVVSYVGFMSSTSKMAQLDEKVREGLIPHLCAALRKEVGQDRFTEHNVATLFTGRNREL